VTQTLDDALFAAPTTLPSGTITAAAAPRLSDYDLLAVNLSGGKDGFPALDLVQQLARRDGVEDRVRTYHADLGPMEWPAVVVDGVRHPSTAELAALQSAALGVPADRHHQVRRTRLDDTGQTVPYDLLTYIAERGRWPWLGKARFCTGDWKTAKVSEAWTPLVRALKPRSRLRRPVRILNILGLRADESRDRAKRPAYRPVTVNRDRHVDEWLPIHTWSLADTLAWNDQEAGIPHHWTYDSAPGAADWLGTSRCSCSLCVLADKRSLLIGVGRRPRLAELYRHVEEVRDEPFRRDWSMRHLIDLAQAPGAPAPGVVLPDDGPEFEALDRAVRAALLLPPRSIRADKDTGPATGQTDLLDACSGCEAAT
jgi:3'-phosphoadenosine 5'-phosphosulfate sulfotransferase (PAPS reductase)/FAD synthetase